MRTIKLGDKVSFDVGVQFHINAHEHGLTTAVLRARSDSSTSGSGSGRVYAPSNWVSSLMLFEASHGVHGVSVMGLDLGEERREGVMRIIAAPDKLDPKQVFDSVLWTILGLACGVPDTAGMVKYAAMGAWGPKQVTLWLDAMDREKHGDVDITAYAIGCAKQARQDADERQKQEILKQAQKKQAQKK